MKEAKFQKLLSWFIRFPKKCSKNPVCHLSNLYVQYSSNLLYLFLFDKFPDHSNSRQYCCSFSQNLMIMKITFEILSPLIVSLYSECSLQFVQLFNSSLHKHLCNYPRNVTLTSREISRSQWHGIYHSDPNSIISLGNSAISEYKITNFKTLFNNMQKIIKFLECYWNYILSFAFQGESVTTWPYLIYRLHRLKKLVLFSPNNFQIEFSILGSQWVRGMSLTQNAHANICRKTTWKEIYEHYQTYEKF